MPQTVAQLTLDLFNMTQHDLDDFHAAGNAETVSAVRAWSIGSGARVIYLCGGLGTGKTHLLQGAVRDAGSGGGRAMYLPLAELFAAGPQILEGLERVDWIALDDLGACRGEPRWEQQLFHFYNALAAHNTRLLWASRQSPATNFFALKDLASRLAASLVYQLRELDEADKAFILSRNAHRRGLDLPAAVIDFIMRRERRDMAALVAILDALDHASLRDGRALTIPFVRTVLANAKAGDAGESSISPG